MIKDTINMLSSNMITKYQNSKERVDVVHHEFGENKECEVFGRMEIIALNISGISSQIMNNTLTHKKIKEFILLLEENSIFNDNCILLWIKLYAQEFNEYFEYIQSIEIFRVACLNYLENIDCRKKEEETLVKKKHSPTVCASNEIITIGNLMWANVANDKESQMYRDDVFEYAKNLRLGGYDDWRLPTIEELKLIVKECGGTVANLTNETDCTYWDDATNQNEINQSYQKCYKEKGFTSGFYYSSDKYDFSDNNGDDHALRGIYFKLGCQTYDNGSRENYLRCVRGDVSKESSISSKKILASPKINTNTDKNKNLMWEDITTTQTEVMNLHEAKEYAKKLRLGGYDDWRLPTIEELKLVVQECGGEVANLIDNDDYDYWEATTLKNRHNQAYKECYHAKGFKPNFYWSSTIEDYDYGESLYSLWVMYFELGEQTRGYNNAKYHVRCVRIF